MVAVVHSCTPDNNIRFALKHVHYSPSQSQRLFFGLNLWKVFRNLSIFQMIISFRVRVRSRRKSNVFAHGWVKSSNRMQLLAKSFFNVINLDK